MGKVILIILLVVAAVFWLRHKALAQRGGRDAGTAGGAAGDEAGGAPGRDSDAPGATGAAGTLRGENMVACVHCSVNVPQREAVQGASGRLYCGAEHRALARDEAR